MPNTSPAPIKAAAVARAMTADPVPVYATTPPTGVVAMVGLLYTLTPYI